MDLIFDKAGTGELVIAVSLWNIGEALGVLDGNRRNGKLTQKEFEVALGSLGQEFAKLIRLKTLEVVPIFTQIVTNAWDVLMEYHVYAGDAVQITTCLYSHSDAFISEDQKLLEASRKAGLRAFHVIKDEQKLSRLV